MEAGSVADISGVHNASNFKAQVEVACTSAMFSTVATSTRYKHLEAELT
jgi:hypothetical protein